MQHQTYPVIDLSATGRNIRSLRVKRGLSVGDLQSYFNFNEPRSIYKWEAGQCLPSIDNLYALSAILRVTMNEILIPKRNNTFTKVVIPLSMPGIASGITMVFVPAVSTFIISRMLGGGTNMLIGDLIDLQFLGNAYNPNLGAAISLVLMVFILLCMSITNQLDNGNEEMEGKMI